MGEGETKVVEEVDSEHTSSNRLRGLHEHWRSQGRRTSMRDSVSRRMLTAFTERMRCKTMLLLLRCFRTWLGSIHHHFGQRLQKSYIFDVYRNDSGA